jgi:Protein of unknown function (DUF2815)
MATDSTQLKLEDVRLSFPDIWKAKSVKKDGEAKFGAQFLLDKKDHKDLIQTVKKALWNAAKGHFGDKAKGLIEKDKLHLCLHEGNEKEYDGYDESNMYISSSSSKRPLVVDRDKTPLAEEDRRPYAGCYVNAVVRIWVQDNEFGKRVNAELMGVQFVRDGEAFGAAPLSEDAFENLDPGKEEKGKGKKGVAEGPPDNGNGGETDDDEVPF